MVASAGHHRLWSAVIVVDTCIILQSNTRLCGRSFAVAGPRLWNTLPNCQQKFVSQTSELFTFRWLLKVVRIVLYKYSSATDGHKNGTKAGRVVLHLLLVTILLQSKRKLCRPTCIYCLLLQVFKLFLIV